MRILVVHPQMGFLGGGERLCCDTIRALLSIGHEITLISEDFDPSKVEEFFGYERMFERVELLPYPVASRKFPFGTASHLMHHIMSQSRELKRTRHSGGFDLIFSTQDPGYIPELGTPVLQWGYFPRHFQERLPRSLFSLPLRRYYGWKISRISLVLAISHYSKVYLDSKWNRTSTLVYPACNMINPRPKRNLVATVSRAIPPKRLELFWRVASKCPEYDFVMLLTRDPRFQEYSNRLVRASPPNGKIVFNPNKELYHRILSEAKVYLHFMEGEHFGITIVEAMSSGCVPVVHDSGGPREFVDEKIGFRWQSIEDVPGFVEKAMKMSPSTACRSRAEDFNYESFEERLKQVFSGLRA